MFVLQSIELSLINNSTQEIFKPIALHKPLAHIIQSELIPKATWKVRINMKNYPPLCTPLPVPKRSGTLHKPPHKSASPGNSQALQRPTKEGKNCYKKKSIQITPLVSNALASCCLVGTFFQLFVRSTTSPSCWPLYLACRVETWSNWNRHGW